MIYRIREKRRSIYFVSILGDNDDDASNTLNINQFIDNLFSELLNLCKSNIAVALDSGIFVNREDVIDTS